MLLVAGLEGARFVDATHTLERLRAIKTPDELAKLRTASELITEAMNATIAGAREGSTKTEIIEQLRREETNRGLHFEYCLLTLGSSHNRAASPQAWAEGRGPVDRFRRELSRLYWRPLPHGGAR